MLIRTGTSHEPHRSRHETAGPCKSTGVAVARCNKSDWRFWVGVAWGRIYSLACALISNVSFLFLFVTRDKMKIGCWGLVSSFSLGHSLHFPPNHPQSHFPSEEYFDQIYHPRVKTQLFLQPRTSPPFQGGGFPRHPPAAWPNR